MSLCPVLPLKEYLLQTRPYRPACLHPFISTAGVRNVSLWTHYLSGFARLLGGLVKRIVPVLHSFRPRHTRSGELVRHCSLGRILQSNRYWGQVRGSLNPPSPLSTWGMSPIGPWTPSPSAVWLLLNMSFRSRILSTNGVASGCYLAILDWVGGLGLVLCTVPFLLSAALVPGKFTWWAVALYI